MRKFNVTGLCTPQEDYMVDIKNKLIQIKELGDARSYFTINRARQYGKITTLVAFEKYIQDEYLVVSISFEAIGEESFESAESFCGVFLKHIAKALRWTCADKEYIKRWEDSSVISFDLLSDHITEMCKNKKVVLMIDEVDSISNHRIFVQFLGLLREKYLARKNNKDFTFHSVILAGVHDIKNIKLKMIQDGVYSPKVHETKMFNSPWNIAADFKVDMSFCADEIKNMLEEYELDHHTKMDMKKISEDIFYYTRGYPFLVSKICKIIDEELNIEWSVKGVKQAVRNLLKEQNTLFDDLNKNIINNADLKRFLYELLFLGEAKNFNLDNSIISLGYRFHYFVNENEKVVISNRIFALRIYDYFISENETSTEIKVKQPLKSEIVKDGHFNMEVCILKFAQHYREIYKEQDIKFLKRHGGLLFLSYLKPLINGIGFFHIESQTNDFRMDIVTSDCDK